MDSVSLRNENTPDLTDRGILFLNTLCWRRPTLALRLPSAQMGLTAVFGMRTGVPPSPKHQHRKFKKNFCLTFNTKSDYLAKIRAFLFDTRLPQFPFRSSVGGLVHLGYTHYCASTWCLSTWSSPTALKRFLILELVSRLDAFSGYPFPT